MTTVALDIDKVLNKYRLFLSIEAPGQLFSEGRSFICTSTAKGLQRLFDSTNCVMFAFFCGRFLIRLAT